AMSLLKLEKWQDAEEEATKCVQRNRTYAKGFFRRAIARRSQGKVKDAMDDLSTVLVLEPGSKDARTQLAQLEAEVKKSEKDATRTTAAPRKKLQIVEVDDDEDEEEEDEVEVPIKRKPAPAKEDPPKPAAPRRAVPLQEAESGIELLDDDDDEVPKPKPKPKPKANPAPAPTAAAAPRHVDPTAATGSQQSPAPADAPKAASPKGKKVIVPRQVALDAAQ
ncbi:TPR-repeat protein, partial [Diplonema papillatum]